MLNFFIKHFRLRSYLIWSAAALHLTTSSACADISTHNLENNIGLYQVVDKKCDVIKNSFNPCSTTYFIEIVKGQFFGIKNTELAFVFWTGDSKIDPELQYTAQLIKGHAKINQSDNKIWLTNNKTTQEFFILEHDQLTRYVLKTAAGSSNNTRNIEYILKPVQRGNFPQVRLNYPGNQ